MEKDTIIQVGGDIEKALKGDYKINPKQVLTEAWQKTGNTRWTINIGLLFVLVLGMLASVVLGQYLGGIEHIFENPQASMILNLVVTIVIWPFLAGVEMMGVLHAVGVKTQPKLVFAFLRRGSWVAICAVMTSIFVSLGLQLLIFPGIFLAVVLSLTIPLVVEKRLSPAKAIVLSIKALRFQWFNIFTVYLALVAILVVAILPLALAQGSSLSIFAAVLFFVLMSYLAPLYFNVKGILYRDIFGMKIHAVADDQQVGNDTFVA
ncbi:hypothetical protein HII17_07800 [Thalassotalea sp. M1531]|uniref:Transmembrane protein n=1 Tax=Thalassotalea algicola TaxID=2716224 RepID=A0A7Y0Q6S7_9GAMM|nr:hypothetical protein [Thalassotalea algicola]NMP31461.1 hypothetical protein [Thalassotalea algicola]